jgi:hypothetical protein
MHGRVQGYSPRPDRAPDLIRKSIRSFRSCLSAWAVMGPRRR